MLRFGTITEVKPEKGLAKVQFAEDGITSYWLPIVQDNTLGDKNYRSMKVNEHVACLMDEHAENGVVVGAIYNKTDTPAYSGEKVGVKFEDGTEVVYDKGAGTYTIKLNSGKLIIDTPANVEITCTKLQLDGKLEVNGTIKATETITSDMEVVAGPTMVHLTTHIHSGVTSGPATTAPPVPGS